jgi:hypothetical protein
LASVETASAAEGADALVDPHGLWPVEEGSSSVNTSHQTDSTTSGVSAFASVSESNGVLAAKGSTPLHVTVDEDSSLTVEFPATVSASREFALFGACGHARGNALIPNSGAIVHWRTAERVRMRTGALLRETQWSICNADPHAAVLTLLKEIQSITHIVDKSVSESLLFHAHFASIV